MNKEEFDPATSRIPLLGMTLEGLTQVAAEMRMPRFAARQMAQWLYDKRVLTIDEMTNLSKKSRELLSRRYIVGREEPLLATKSVDGTVKYLFRGSRRAGSGERVYTGW